MLEAGRLDDTPRRDRPPSARGRCARWRIFWPRHGRSPTTPDPFEGVERDAAAHAV